MVCSGLRLLYMAEPQRLFVMQTGVYGIFLYGKALCIATHLKIVIILFTMEKVYYKNNSNPAI